MERQRQNTLYFRNFKIDDDEEDKLKHVFGNYGQLTSFYINFGKAFGMVQYSNTGECLKAIEGLNNTPPLFLFVNYAKNSSERRESNEFKNEGNMARARTSSHYQNNPEIVSYTKDDIIYLDRFNKRIDVLVDEVSGEVYVPVSRVEGVRRVIHKSALSLKPITDLDEYIDVDEFERNVPIDQNSHERSFAHQNSDHFEVDKRKVSPQNKTNFQGRNSYGRMNAQNSDSFDNNSNDKGRRSFGRFEKRSNTYNSDTFDNNSNDGNSQGRKNTGKFERRSNTHNSDMFENNSNDGNSRGRTFENNSNDSNSGLKSFRQREHFGSSDQRNRVESKRFNENRNFSTPNQIEDENENWNDTKVESTSVKSPVTTVSPRAAQSVSARELSERSSTPTTSRVSDTVKPKAKTLKTVELPEGQYTKVKVETKINDCTGWVSLCDEASKDTLIEIMSDILTEVKTANKIQQPEVGTLCLAIYADAWFRAVVIKTSPEIIVRYIDYGNEQANPEGGFLQLSEKLQNTPAQAFCIKLADGAPCKIEDDEILNVKPFKKENDVVIVHVENGLYSREEVKEVRKIVAAPVASEENGVLKKIQKNTLSMLKVGFSGIFQRTITLGKNKCIINFIPDDFLGYCIELVKNNPQRSSSFKPKVGDIVSALNEEGWNRACILKITDDDIFTIAFIDYGVIADVEEVRTISEEILNFPLFSYVCTFENEEELLQTNDEAKCELTQVSNGGFHIKILDQSKNLNAKLSFWNPCEQESAQSSSKPTTIQTVKLESGMNVRLVCARNDFLYVRTKQTADILKRIEKLLKEYKPKELNGTPSVGEFGVCKYDNVWCRILIKAINNNMASIDYIDYGDIENTNVSNIKLLEPELYQEPIAAIKIKLAQFTNKRFSPKALDYLEDLSAKNAILKAVFTNEASDEVNLITKDDVNISDILMKLDESRDKLNNSIINKEDKCANVKIPGKDDAPQKAEHFLDIPMGEAEVIYLSDINLENKVICVAYNNPAIVHKVHVELLNEMTHYGNNVAPQEGHAPVDNEAILARNNGKWYRAICTGNENNKFNLFFIDYGFSMSLPANDIRRLPAEFNQIEALANFAVLDGLPDKLSNALIKHLEDFFDKNARYEAIVKEKLESEDCYLILFPSIINILKSEGLI